jgi:hypothetical protein
VDAFEAGGGTTGYAVDLPAFREQVVSEVVSYDAGDSGDERYLGHRVWMPEVANRLLVARRAVALRTIPTHEWGTRRGGIPPPPPPGYLGRSDVE